MKLRRTLNGHEPQVQAQIDGQWISLSRLDNLEAIASSYGINQNLAQDTLAVCRLGQKGLDELAAALRSLAPDSEEAGETVLPFKPASFRDFMLFEQHVIDSTRGFVKRFLPKMYPIANAVEKLTGKPFKRYKPHKLWYQQPIYYLSNHLNFGISGDEIVWPEYTKALDYELEIGAVITKPLYNASPEQAEEAIGGYVVLNDFSARDIQKDEMESGFGPQKAKHFYSTMSPVLVTASALKNNISSITGTVSINGKEVSTCSTTNMAYSFGEAISFASKGEQLHAGELFGSGTLPGGSGMETDNWVNPGDVLTFEVDLIGELSNTIK